MQSANDALAIGPDDAARLLGVGRTTLFQLLRDGEIRSFQIGGRRLIRRADLEAFVARKAAQYAA